MSRPVALPSYYGPRSFVVARDGEVTGALLHEQSASRAAASALSAARESAAIAGAPGAAHKGARVRARRQQRAAAATTSASAAASTRLEEAAAARYAALVAQAAAQQQPLSPAAATFFSGSYLVKDDVQPQPNTARAHAQSQQQRHSTGSQTARASSVTSPTGSGGGGRSIGGWSGCHGSMSRSSIEVHSPPPVPPSRPSETSARRHWGRRVEQRRLAADGGGGDVAILHALTNAHQFGSLPQPQPAPQAVPPSPYPSAAHADADAARHLHQEQLFPQADDHDGERDGADYDHAHKSLFTTPLPPHPSSHPPRHSHPQELDCDIQLGHANPVAADPAALPSPSLLDPRFHRSLRSYTQQWWVRLHNSENKVNTSPYYIGNKSVYYHDDQNGTHAPDSTAAREESKEPPVHADRLPPIAQQNAAGTASGSPPPLKRFVTSTALDPPAAAGSGNPVSALRSLLQSAPAGSSFSHTSSARAPLSPTAGSAGGGARRGSAYGDSAAQRMSLLARHTRVQTLVPEAAGKLNPTWAAQPHLLTWKRHADTMTLTDPPPPVPPVAATTSTTARTAAPSPDELYERGLAEVRAIRAANARRGTQFEYDRVSELHGFLSQKNIRQLLRQSNYNRRELIALFVRFKALCALSRTPHGIDKGTFKRGVARLAVEDDRFVSRVFSLVDDDGSGQIEWEEFLMAMSALEKGELEAKVRFFFQTYDLDADGYINRQDLATMFHSSSMLDDDETTVEVVNTFVNKVFATFGASTSGRISFDDVLRYMQRNGEKEDVWDVFGRSMLQDFSARPNR